jgi:hypothetical protein
MVDKIALNIWRLASGWTIIWYVIFGHLVSPFGCRLAGGLTNRQTGRRTIMQADRQRFNNAGQTCKHTCREEGRTSKDEVMQT